MACLFCRWRPPCCFPSIAQLPLMHPLPTGAHSSRHLQQQCQTYLLHFLVSSQGIHEHSFHCVQLHWPTIFKIHLLLKGYSNKCWKRVLILPKEKAFNILPGSRLEKLIDKKDFTEFFWKMKIKNIAGRSLVNRHKSTLHSMATEAGKERNKDRNWKSISSKCKKCSKFRF